MDWLAKVGCGTATMMTDGRETVPPSRGVASPGRGFGVLVRDGGKKVAQASENETCATKNTR